MQALLMSGLLATALAAGMAAAYALGAPAGRRGRGDV